MKKWLIGSLVGAILLFYLAIRFMGCASGLHDGEYKYHPQQEQIMSNLSAVIKEDGQYMLPREAPGASSEEHKKAITEMEGKPWAVITYKSTYENRMVSSMIRGFVVDLIIVLLLMYVMAKQMDLSLGNVYMVTLAIGLIAWLWHPYTEHIWFQTPMAVISGALLEWIIAYSILGLWLGFWLRRNSRTEVR